LRTLSSRIPRSHQVTSGRFTAFESASREFNEIASHRGLRRARCRDTGLARGRGPTDATAGSSAQGRAALLLGGERTTPDSLDPGAPLVLPGLLGVSRCREGSDSHGPQDCRRNQNQVSHLKSSVVGRFKDQISCLIAPWIHFGGRRQPQAAIAAGANSPTGARRPWRASAPSGEHFAAPSLGLNCYHALPVELRISGDCLIGDKESPRRFSTP
jgi:hypothetical protein